MTPIGIAVNNHLNIYLQNAAIQEYNEPDEVTNSIFKSDLKVEDGYIYPLEKAGIGVEFDEELAKKYPVRYRAHEWTQARLPHGVIHTP